MKILHFSDVHGDLNALKAVVEFAKKRNDLEAVVCSGDLLGQCLTNEQAEQMQHARSFIFNNVRSDKPISLTDVLDFIKRSTFPDSIKRAANDYSGIEQEFNKNAEAQYKNLSNIFSEFPQTVFTIPGNWDSKHYFDYFGRFNVHEFPREINGIEFTGYGGDSFIPVFLPQTKAVFHSDEGLYKTLVEQVPEIAVTHTPPKGVLDKGANGESYGSWANLAYIRNPDESSDLLLCGHVHESEGCARPEGLRTLVVNAGNVGKFVNSPKYGTFVEVDYKNADSISVSPYRVLENGEICDLKAKKIVDIN